MRVPVTGLVGHPGETRDLTRAVAPDAFGTEPWGPAADEVHDPVELDLHLDAVVEGILVRGAIGYTVSVPCARCLEPQPHHVDAHVAELFVAPSKRDPDDEDDPGYELIDDETALDLTTLVRDALIVELPVRVLCREACRGLCPTCGANRNQVDCGHGDEPATDPRWAKLADLELPTD